MKRILLSTIIGLSCLCANAQSNLINNGAIIKVQNTANLRVDNGGIVNRTSGVIDNQGNVYLDSDFNQLTAATYNGSASSWLWFEGTGNENINSDAPLNIARLRVDNGNRLVLGNDLNISTDADLMTNGNIELGNFDLVMAPGGTIAGYDANNYIISNGSGYLQQEVGASAVVFPVGNAIYNPATLSNAGTLDNFQARVEDFVRGDYPAGNIETIGIVGKAWFIEEQTIGGSDVTMTLQWETADELPGFSRIVSGISHWTGAAWDRSPTWTAAASAGASWTQTRSGITSFSPFAVEDVDMDLPIELLAFDAKRSNSSTVALTWSTASELNNKGFFVERMLEGETEFSIVQWVDGFGTTSETTHYAINNDNSFTGNSYYRLRQVDFDETESLSEIRAVRGSVFNEFTNVSLYPVPVSNELSVRFGKLPKGVRSGEVRIIDLQGRVLFDASVAVQSNQVLLIEEVTQWPAGMYMLHIRLDNGSTMTEKFVKE